MAEALDVSRSRRKLGEILIEAGLLSPAQLNRALPHCGINGKRLGEVLISQHAITEQDLARCLSSQLNFPYVDLGREECDGTLVAALTEILAKRHKVVPIRLEGKTLSIAMADPLAYEKIADLAFATGYAIRPVIATASAIQETMGRLYGKDGSNHQSAPDSTEDFDPRLLDTIATLAPSAAAEAASLSEATQQAPMVRLANMLITHAVRLGASDIHIEPGPFDTSVRSRIDGLLRKTLQVPKAAHAPLISRLKVVSNLDIAERRLPQDGVVRIKIEQRDIDLRVSTMPTLYGEKMVLRIADQAKGAVRLDGLGLSEKEYAIITSFTERRKGIILVTGPTGSGKTSTLYALIHAIRSISLNVLTIEDPVETKIESVNQTQINPEAGLTFASALRSILRQDPDVILVGEIRDKETAEIAVRAAMTGHLVLSTLHTNDAPSAITRLIDIGIPRYLVASLVEGVIAQRLVRKICDRCKEERSPSPAALRALKINPETLGGVPFYAGRGCPRCGGTGYAGRVAIMEILDPTARIREMITAEAPEQSIRLAALAANMCSLGEDGLTKAKAGITTIEELLRVVDVSNKTESLCPTCSRIVQYDFLLCPYCETPLSRSCHGCRRPLQLEWRVCPYCASRSQAGEPHDSDS